MNTLAWGLRLACNHLSQHDGCRSSCCLSKSETDNENKSAKEILNEIDSFFWTNRQRLTKKTGHYAWPCCSFSWSDHACNHPSCRRTCCSSSPCCCVDHNHGMIVSMTIVRLAIVAIVLVGLMVIAIFVTAMLMVA